MAQVSKRVRDVVRARLAAAWATKLNLTKAGYSLAAAELAKLAGIDWTGAQRKQFFQGQIDPNALDDTTATTYPLVILFTSEASHDGTEKFRSFSGSVLAHLEFIWTWRQGNALPNFDEVGDLIEDTLLEVFHDRAWVGAIGNGVVYNGEFAFSRGPVTQAGEHWRQACAARLRFGVDV